MVIIRRMPIQNEPLEDSMQQFSVLVTEPDTLPGAKEILLNAGATLHFMARPITEAALIRHFTQTPIDAVFMSGSPPLSGPVLQAANTVKVISKRGAGIDSADMKTATALGIAVMVANGANADAVAEHALAMMLSLSREFPGFDRDLRKGHWRDSRPPVQEFRGRIVGIVGYGAIGRKTAHLAHACGAQVVIHTRSNIECPPGMQVERDFERLLSSVDILSLHCSLNDSTRKLIGRAALAHMKPDALLINTARGGLIDEPALVDALRNGKLAGAGLDTFAVEPATPDNPLFALANVLCTPHAAGVTANALSLVCTTAARNIVSYLQGAPYAPADLLNPEVLANSRLARL